MGEDYYCAKISLSLFLCETKCTERIIDNEEEYKAHYILPAPISLFSCAQHAVASTDIYTITPARCTLEYN